MLPRISQNYILLSLIDLKLVIRHSLYNLWAHYPWVLTKPILHQFGIKAKPVRWFLKLGIDLLAHLKAINVLISYRYEENWISIGIIETSCEIL